jgi:hypothetical protein
MSYALQYVSGWEVENFSGKLKQSILENEAGNEGITFCWILMTPATLMLCIGGFHC